MADKSCSDRISLARYHTQLVERANAIMFARDIFTVIPQTELLQSALDNYCDAMASMAPYIASQACELLPTERGKP